MYNFEFVIIFSHIYYMKTIFRFLGRYLFLFDKVIFEIMFREVNV